MKKKQIINPKGKLCLCGRPAVKYEKGGYVCHKCLEIEKKLYAVNPKERMTE